MMYPPPPPYPLPYPEPPKRQLPRWIWVMVALSALVVVICTLAEISWATQPGPNDNKAYQYGYSHFGPSAVSQAEAGVLPGSACEFISTLEVQLDFIDLGGQQPGWWDTTEVRRGCVNYLHEHGF
jgi:hypothetical protein